MLYPKNQSPKPDEKLFANPTCEYRAAPFWAWNCELNQELLNKEIDVMKQMGMGGFHMHVRVGMSTRYLSEKFFEYIKGCVQKAKSNEMLAWLYDEDKWPSGFAGGYVTENPAFRQKYLLFTPDGTKQDEESILLGRYAVRLDDEGYLQSYRLLKENESAGEDDLWFAWQKTSTLTAWCHFKGYSDTMCKDAIASFIDITHEKYKEKVGEEFGKICPAIFTDEPQLIRETEMHFSKKKQDIVLAYTPDFEQTYRAAYGESFLEQLPDVIWESKQRTSRARYYYHDHVTERFAQAFSDQIGAWCRQNGILMTGHMMEEPTLRSQTNAIGECMRSYRGFTLPGVDMLCDYREYNTVKQSASAAHQQGCPGVLSELYGVTNWDFDFRGHKLQGDWQAALGVSVRVPHLYWVSMHGESKRDYPASIGHQSSWWKEYSYIEDHFARVNTLMTRGKPVVRVGVIHPIETYWINYGPADLTGAKRAELDRRFAELTEWLLMNTVDFDFICESRLPELYHPEKEGFAVGEMQYDCVLVPACESIRKTTLDALKAFRKKGGKVVFMGVVPSLVDALPDGQAGELAQDCTLIPWEKYSLMNQLAPLREITITDEQANPSDGLIYGLRQDGNERNLFICHARADDHRRVQGMEHYRITLKGAWNVTLYQTLTGAIAPFPARIEGNQTTILWDCYPQDSLLLRLTPVAEKADSQALQEDFSSGQYGVQMSEEFRPRKEDSRITLLPEAGQVILHEDNVCVLDMAHWRIDEGEWQEQEEMLRIGVKAKEQLHLSTAAISGAQPWILPPEKPEHTLSVRTSFIVDEVPGKACLALEDADEAEIWLNGEKLAKQKDGVYVDDSITRIVLPALGKGVNWIEVKKPFVTASSVENMFILGEFGVKVQGRQVHIIHAPQTLSYGDWTNQGLPFYGGALTYRFTIEGGRALKVRLGKISAPCTVVELDGKRVGNVSLAPHEADLGYLDEGKHTLEITLFASRINTFGTLHLNDESLTWFGPQAWRTQGMDWTYGYKLKPSGLMSEPWLIEYK